VETRSLVIDKDNIMMSGFSTLHQKAVSCMREIFCQTSFFSASPVDSVLHRRRRGLTFVIAVGNSKIVHVFLP
jgi:hypothetical protein